MTYKEAITNEMNKLAQDPMVRFIGYNTAKGSRMYGTLAAIPADKCIEAPVAENLMMGLAMGMSLEGYKPVVCFERHDFLLLALDAIVNHLDKLPWMSGGQFSFPVIVRAIVGSSTPLAVGPQHSQDHTGILVNSLMHTRVAIVNYCDDAKEIEQCYDFQRVPSIIVEYRNTYDQQIPHLCVLP